MIRRLLGECQDRFKRGPGTHAVLPLEEALPRLMPMVRPRFQFEARSLSRPGSAPVFRPLADTFALGLVVACPEADRDVGARELEAWGADFDLLLQRARSNLLQRGGEERFRPVRPGLFRSTWEDNLDGSRILLPGLLKRLDLKGDPVAVLANPDTLLVAGAEDSAALDWLLRAALEFGAEDPRARNGCPLRLRAFRWEPWAAPPGPGLGELLRPLLHVLPEQHPFLQHVLLDPREPADPLHQLPLDRLHQRLVLVDECHLISPKDDTN